MNMSVPISAVVMAFFVATASPVPHSQPAPTIVQQAVPLIEVGDLQAMIANNAPVLLLDVRTPDEYRQGHIPGAVLMPVSSIADRYQSIPKDVTLVVYCRSGGRSAIAVRFLRQHGYESASLAGGYMAWSGMPRR